MTQKRGGSTSNILPAGIPAPDFRLPATPEQTLTLKGLRGRPVGALVGILFTNDKALLVSILTAAMAALTATVTVANKERRR